MSSRRIGSQTWGIAALLCAMVMFFGGLFGGLFLLVRGPMAIVGETILATLLVLSLPAVAVGIRAGRRRRLLALLGALAMLLFVWVAVFFLWLANTPGLPTQKSAFTIAWWASLAAAGAAAVGFWVNVVLDVIFLRQRTSSPE